MSIPSLDPHYDKTVLLLPMDGANNGIVFPDYSANPKTITRFGDTRTLTAVKKYGTASAYFDGSGDYLTIPHSEDFNLGSGDFTIEAWVRLNTLADWRTIVSKNPTDQAGAWRLLIGAGGFLAFGFFTGSNWRAVNANGATSGIVVNEWFHVATTRSGNDMRLIVNGIQKGNTSSTSDAIPSLTSQVSVGRLESTNTWFFDGYLADLRITKGVARYTANFTPPGPLVVAANAISGTVTDRNGNPAVRKLFAMPRVMPSRVFGPVTSGVDGTYTFSNLPAAEYSLVALADDSDPLQNDIIHRVNVGAL